jgi:ankyrin repeat protein
MAYLSDLDIAMHLLPNMFCGTEISPVDSSMAAEAAIEAIHRAAWQGDAVSVTRMLDEDPQRLFTVEGGGTLLIKASWHGRVDVVRLLLERGAEINQADARGNTALHLAVSRRHEAVVSILVSYGADISRKAYRGQTALMHASYGGHVAVVRLLLRSMGIRGLDERSEFGRTAVWYACIEGHAEVLRALLLAGADHTIADNNDRTPLQVAEEKGRHECVALLQVRPPIDELP